jgi:prevent-host-death family protein
MVQIGAYDAKTRLAELLDRVQNGERIVITRHGRPVAQLVPVEDAPQMTVAEAIAGIRELGGRTTLGPGLTLRDLIEEGRE